MSFNSPSKNTIRQFWSKPILRYLTDRLGAKLVYMGLPAPEAEDIKEWINYLRIIYAFQCRQYPDPSEPDQSRDNIEQLESYLNSLEAAALIDTYVLYDGYIEEVVTKGFDSIGNRFGQNDLITVYNLDFCNQITFPLEVTDPESLEPKSVYKFDAIHELMRYQAEISAMPKRFVLFMTINSDYEDEVIHKFISHTTNQAVRQIHHKIRRLRGKKAKTRLLKSFIHFNVAEILDNQKFRYTFLPTIAYQGIGGTKMLHFTVIGEKSEITATYGSVNPLLSYISQKLITPQEDQFVAVSHQNAEFEIDVDTDPIWHLDQCELLNPTT